MIVWTGWGILAGVVWVIILLFSEHAIDAACGPGYYTGHAWPKLLASAVAAPAIWGLGRALNGSPRSERRQQCGARHTLFFMPMEHWGLIFLGLGVIIAIMPGKPGERTSALRQQLQGEWLGVRGEHQGRTLEGPEHAEFLRQHRLVFDADSFLAESPTMTARGTYWVDASAWPPKMRLLKEDGEEIAAVFEFRGGQLHFCATAPGDPAPSGFTTSPDSSALLIVLAKAR